MTVGAESTPHLDLDGAKDPTIRSRVLTLVAIVLLPFIGVMTWLATDYAKLQRQLIEKSRNTSAEVLTRILDREMATIIGTLRGLASSDDLASGDFEKFDRQAKSVVRLPDVSEIRVYDPSGKAVYSTLDRTGEKTKTLPPQDVAKVVKGAPLISGLAKGENGRPSTFSVSVPAIENGRLRYLISGEIEPSRFKDIFNSADVPNEWISAVVDKNGLFIARSLTPESHVGTPARPEIVKVAADDSARGEFENTTWEGVRASNSFHKSALTGWTSVVAVPTNVLSAPYRRSMAFVFLGSTAISLVSLFAAMLLASRISEPIRRLRDVATAIVEGRVPPDTPLRIAELNDVRDALNQSAEKREHLATIVASSGDAIMSVGLDGRITSWNRGAENLFGYTAKEAIGRHKSIIALQEQTHEIGRHLDTVKEGKSLRVETQRMNRDGKIIDVSLDMAPIRDATGKIIAMSSIMHDITERKMTERHQRFLNRELTHRTKNLLAIVQSMARQTARSSASLQDFETRYTQRLQGLAASHDLLVNQNWVGAPLDELIRRQIDSFAEANRANIAITGPEIVVSAKAAQTIGLVLHELATNSMKYGALSVPHGKVSIEWEYAFEGDTPSGLKMQWVEHDGPPVQPPKRKGFGNFVIDRMAAQSLNAAVTVDYNPQGLVWSFSAPLKELLYEPEFIGGGTI